MPQAIVAMQILKVKYDLNETSLTALWTKEWEDKRGDVLIKLHESQLE